MTDTDSGLWPDNALEDPHERNSVTATAHTLNGSFRNLGFPERLACLSAIAPGTVVLTTSFGLEDQALTHMLVEAGINCRFVTLDTGRLFPETHAVWAATEHRYGIQIEAFHPCADALDRLVQQNGINGFYHSAEARHACCEVRKMEPLGRALSGAAVWLTGVRADQSNNRQKLNFVTYDTKYRLLKINPILDWTRDEVIEVVRDAGVPCNALHKQGFLSIGCAPCTRAVASGEPERAGR